TVFDTRANILDLLLAPARIPDHVALEAQALATRTVEALDGVGVFGVEMFLSKAGKLFINEVAPRPHNSGHYTIEACVTCQFEQHLRAITGLPLGATDLMRPAAMINLLGEQDMAGRPMVEGLREAMSIPGVSVHIYGKGETRPFRKMGHVTILDEDLEQARKKALRVKGILKIKAEVRA
ncbi:MAG: ATP-grasp domain-containing protein, partial [Bacillota bacterium]